jgi:hypothetical protein
VQRLVSGSWLVPTSYQALEGLHPNTVEYLPSTFSHEVFAEYSSIFRQSMKGVAFSDEHLDRSHRGTLSSSRELVFSKGSVRATLRLGELEIQSPVSLVEMDWATGFDTLVVGKTKTIDAYLRTAPFTVPSNAALKYRSTAKRDGTALLPANLQLVFEVVDAATQQPLAILQQVTLNTLSNNRIDGNYALPLTSFNGRSVYVQGRVIGFDTSVQVLAIDYYHNPGTKLPRYSGHVSEEVQLPTSAQLTQNYPNPFNPLTTIRYRLAQPAETDLVVTDVYGRIVDRLAQGHKAAGVHTVQWDASGHPSGVYYYTLTTEKTKITRRMHLIR